MSTGRGGEGSEYWEGRGVSTGRGGEESEYWEGRRGE